MNGVTWKRVCETKPIDRIIIIASGPSLAKFEMKSIKKLNAYKIAVNDAGKFAPFADAWFTLDPWGLTRGQIPDYFSGKKYAAVPGDYGRMDAKCNDHKVAAPDDVHYLHRLQSHNNPYISSNSAYMLGLSEDASCISTGNSGYGALNLAYHLRPKKIVLLGIDGTSGYFYPSDKKNGSLQTLPLLFESTLDQLKDKNIQVVNGSPNSKVACFLKMNIEDSLEWLMT